MTATRRREDGSLSIGSRHPARRIATSLVLAAMLATAVAPALAAPGSTAKKPAATAAKAPAPIVRIDLKDASVTPTGTLSFSVNTELRADVTALTVTAKVLTPSGAVLYQHTETRGALPADTYAFGFSKVLGGGATREGRYRVQVQVKAGSAATVDTDANALVVTPSKHAPVPVAVVVRVAHAPATDPDGAFVSDPSSEATGRADVRALARLASSRPDLRITLALSPLTLDEWKAASGGYRSIAVSSSVNVSADASSALDCGATLDALASAVTSGSVPMLAVPFAEPDLVGLAGVGGVGDLRDQLDLGFNTYQVALRSQPDTGTALWTGGLPAAALPFLAERNTAFVLVRAAALKRAGVAAVAPGVYRLAEATATVVALDDHVSRLLSDPAADAAHVADALFDRLDAKATEGQPVVAVVDIGPDATTTAGRLATALDALAASGWIRIVSAGDAAATPPLSGVDVSGRAAVTSAPAGWWAAIATARDDAAALAAAAGPGDPDSRRAARDTLIAESGLWAGADGSWREAGRAHAYAETPVAIAAAVLGGLRVSGSPVTLSGTTGKVPVNVHNPGQKILSVVVTASAPRVTVPDGGRVAATLRPGDNYVTIPVDMGSTFSAKLRVGVTAGPLELSNTTVQVRASYVDRLALVGLVVLVLVGMLFYIRRRTRAASEAAERSSVRATARDTSRRDRSAKPGGPRRRPE
jgi:hypothetical protein